MKKYIWGILIGLLIGVFTNIAYANNPIKLIVNDKEIPTDVPPQNINGRVLVPVRFVVEALGADIKWDEENNAVVITSKQKTSDTFSSVYFYAEEKMRSGKETVAEALGAKVEWDDVGQAVVINSFIAQIDSKDNPPDDNLVPAFELLKKYEGKNAPDGTSRVLIFDNLDLKIELPRSLSEGGMVVVKRKGLVVDQVYAIVKSGRLFLDKRIKSYFPQ